MKIYFNCRSYIKESYNIVEERHSTSDGVAYSDNHIEVESVVETEDGHHDMVDDLHPLVDQDIVAFLRDENQSCDVDILDNSNIDIEGGRY